MTYQVLARKLRPQTLCEVIGQPLVVQAITNALNNKTMHPVYLLTGTRGVGKTTLARIIAKSLNCEAGPHPCLSCDTCQMIQNGIYPDLYEIDAASRTKVEDTRDVLEHVQYLPQIGKKKVYLIDEVHMLSQHSFNALLKTLEEPPEHTQFILATTEPEKIPKTILSRCLHFNLQPISTEMLSTYIQDILSKEKITFEIEALNQIATAGEGSVRDTLSLLDQCLAISPSRISVETTQQLLQTIPKTALADLLKTIHQQNIIDIEKRCDQFAENNIQFRALLQQLAELLAQTATQQLLKKDNELTKLWPPEYLQVLYDMVIKSLADFEFHPSPKIAALMTFIRMSVFSPNEVDPAQPLPKQQQSWDDIIQSLPTSQMLKTLLSHCTLESKTENQWELKLAASHKHLLSPTSQHKVSEAATKLMNQPISVRIDVGTQNEATPAEITEQKSQHARQQAQSDLEKDPVLNSLLKGLNVEPDKVDISN